MIVIKSQNELELIQKSCEIVSEILNELAAHVRPGITTAQIEQIACGLIEKSGAISAFKGYRGFPGYICTSVNEVVVHGIANNRPLREGDIVSIDVGVNKGGYYGDGAVTVPVGEISKDAQRLLDVAKQALGKAIDKSTPDNRVGDISYAIQNYVESRGFNVVRDFVGHGIGAHLHEDPQIPNFGAPNHGPKLKAGMVLAIESMVTQGSFEIAIQNDGWTAVTKDRKLAAHFEDVVAITQTGPRILTRSPQILGCQKKRP
ncbi:MAG: type I methionyl aminopeptidase [Candidatus Omnitrophota bacterium]